MPSKCIGVHSQKKNWFRDGQGWCVYSGFEDTHKY